MKVTDWTELKYLKAVANEKFCYSIFESLHSTDSDPVPQTGIQTHTRLLFQVCVCVHTKKLQQCWL